MTKGKMIGLGILAAVLFLSITTCSYVISVLDREATIRNMVSAKQIDNTNVFDNMWKTISQTAEVTDTQRQALLEIFTSYAESRTPDSAGRIISWIQESVPNVDTTTFNNLQNIIVSSRDSWARNQRELIDLDREHDTPFDRVVSGTILSIFGRERTEITIVTSSRTQRAFATGTDDDVNVFHDPDNTSSETSN